MNISLRDFCKLLPVLALLLVLFCLSAGHLHALEGLCVRVVDGDTIVIRTGSKTERVRLRGIDAPELEQTGGREAGKYLAGLILNKKVRIAGESRDNYNRLLGLVFLGKENVNLTMVREGWAWDYALSNAGSEYTLAEKKAREAGRGLWAGESPQAPWKFRRSQRGEISDRRSAPADCHVPSERRAPTTEAVDNLLRPGADKCLYWISNSGKTHNRNCEMFLGNSGSGSYSNTPSPVDARCCGGAGR